MSQKTQKQMAFMQPYYLEGFFADLDDQVMPWDDFLDSDILIDPCFVSVEKVHGVGTRLSAPGYLDCTEWTLFDSEREAKHHWTEQGICWACGETLPNESDDCLCGKKEGE